MTLGLKAEKKLINIDKIFYFSTTFFFTIINHTVIIQLQCAFISVLGAADYKHSAQRGYHPMFNQVSVILALGVRQWSWFVNQQVVLENPCIFYSQPHNPHIC